MLLNIQVPTIDIFGYSLLLLSILLLIISNYYCFSSSGCPTGCNTPCNQPCRPCNEPCRCEKPPCKHCEMPCCEKTCNEKPCCGSPCNGVQICDQNCYDKPCNSCCGKPCYENSCCDKPCCERPCCEKPCQDKPCPEKPCCDKPCNEKPSCECCKPNGCSGPTEVITTIEIVEICPAYEQVVFNDEVQFIETNQTILSSYSITQTQFDQQQSEAQLFQDEQQLARKGICGFGIRGDEMQQPNNSTIQLDAMPESNLTKGLIAEVANANNNRPTKPCTITSGWECPKFGRYPHPSNCRKYVQCRLCGNNQVYECPFEQAFDGKQCSSDWSACSQISECKYDREVLADPWDESNYFICVRKKATIHKFFIFRRFCPEGHIFDINQLQCKPICTYGCSG